MHADGYCDCKIPLLLCYTMCLSSRQELLPPPVHRQEVPARARHDHRSGVRLPDHKLNNKAIKLQIWDTVLDTYLYCCTHMS